MSLSHNYCLVIPLWMSTVFFFSLFLSIQIKIYTAFFIILTTVYYLKY